jgi:hypothetical protein
VHGSVRASCIHFKSGVLRQLHSAKPKWNLNVVLLADVFNVSAAPVQNRSTFLMSLPPAALRAVTVIVSAPAQQQVQF